MTGAGSGIGRATAELFAVEGTSVLVIDTDQHSATETVRLVRDAGGTAFGHVGDVGSSRRTSRGPWSPPTDNSVASISSSATPRRLAGNAVELSEPEWDRTYAVCLKATWSLAHHGVPRMLERGGGSIVIISSVHAIVGFHLHTACRRPRRG